MPILTVRLGIHAHERLDERSGPVPDHETTVKHLNKHCTEAEWETDTASGARRLYVPELGGTFVLAEEEHEPVWYTKTFVQDTAPREGKLVEVRWVGLD